MTDRDRMFLAIIAELHAAAAELLDPGLAPAAPRPRASRFPGTLSGLLQDIDSLARLLPRALGELEHTAPSVSFALEASPIPRRAAAPRRALDYARDGDRVVPKRWHTSVPVLEPDPRPLSWLLGLIETLTQRFLVQRQRLERVIREALAARNVDSPFAEAERNTLRETEAAIAAAEASLRRMRSRVLRKGAWRIVASDRLPNPFPTGASWSGLRSLAAVIRDPGVALSRTLPRLLCPPVHVADEGFLYQRWVGLRLLGHLRARGWRVIGDAVLVLFVGGELRLIRDHAEIRFFCEPRILASPTHTSGLRAARKEATPDYLFVTPGPTGCDAYVLDATLALAEEVRREKARYLQVLEFVAPTWIAGVPIRHTPRNAWAAAPLDRSTCELHAADGRSGTVPMSPLRGDDDAVRAWLADLEAHALAWARSMA